MPASAITFSPGVAQTIDFTQPADALIGDGPVTVTASVSSHRPVSFTTTTPGACTLPENGSSSVAVALVGVGTCTITASQDGDTRYAAATPVSRSFLVRPAAPVDVSATAGDSSITVTWSAPPNQDGISGYTAIADPGPATCTTTGTTGCVLGGVAATAYTVTVVSNSAAGVDTPA